MNYTEYMASFDAEKVKKDVVAWIRDWFAENGPDSPAVLGISGGKDSSVVAALCAEALGRERVFGVLMPQGEQKDIADSLALVKHLGIPYAAVNVGPAVEAVTAAVGEAFAAVPQAPAGLSQQAKVNLPPRIRMSTVYAVSQTLNGRVANTCNLSEDWVGYSTRYGDSVGDFSPLSMLTTDEVIAIGKACGLPAYLVEKTPSDGLCGKTDEDNLGFTYRTLNIYIRTGVCEDAAIKELIDRKHKANLFKLQLMPFFKFEP